jgi:hypothetical protein
MTSLAISCTCGATVLADVYADGVTHTTLCRDCGGMVCTTVEVMAGRRS